MLSCADVTWQAWPHQSALPSRDFETFRYRFRFRLLSGSFLLLDNFTGLSQKRGLSGSFFDDQIIHLLQPPRGHPTDHACHTRYCGFIMVFHLGRSHVGLRAGDAAAYV